MFAKTAPPRKTMCRRRGGSSMRTLNFYTKLVLLSDTGIAHARSIAPGFRPAPW